MYIQLCQCYMFINYNNIKNNITKFRTEKYVYSLGRIKKLKERIRKQ